MLQNRRKVCKDLFPYQSDTAPLGKAVQMHPEAISRLDRTRLLQQEPNSVSLLRALFSEVCGFGGKHVLNELKLVGLYKKIVPRSEDLMIIMSNEGLFWEMHFVYAISK